MGPADARAAQIEKIVTKLKTKYPSAKRIELMTTVRVIGNKMCNPGANYGRVRMTARDARTATFRRMPMLPSLK